MNNMTHFEHLNFESRKIINNQITTHKSTAREIADILGTDPTTISKELKRHRFLIKQAPSNVNNPICPRTNRYPYVCNGCNNRVTCKFTQYRYEASKAQQEADYVLVASRRGINLTKEEFDILDAKIKDGLLNKKSIYDVVKGNDDIQVSVPTVYKYISDGILTTRRLDLPYAVTYKKRKKQNKKYEYLENTKIDRSTRTFLDYLAYIRSHPHSFIAQMDFLGSIITDSKSILTLTIPEIHFVILFIVENKNSKKVVDVFDHLETNLSVSVFRNVFPCILTDRDPCFSDYDGIERSCIDDSKRTNVFYCDAFKSNQKANVENMNKQLRKFFPKKQSIDHLTIEQIKEINYIINDQKIGSLSGYSANEAFKRVYGETALENIYK